ncbi:MAG: hypothetical protein Alpg2KO_09460 [Alphaproteobacteria bacterium]
MTPNTQKNRFTARRDGASLLSYGMVVGLISVVALAATQSTGSSVTSLFGTTSGALEEAAASHAGTSGAAQPDPSAEASTVPQDVFTFTNCGKTGGTSPNTSECTAEYAGTSLDGAVTVNGNNHQVWVVPQTGTYQIQADGAAGGSAVQAGGSGARVSANFSLTAGQTLLILVGQRGEDSPDTTSFSRASGGGGGSYVYSSSTATLLVVAGGGGGAGTNNTASSAQQVGADAPWNSTSGTSSEGPSRFVGATAGNGGARCDNTGASAGAGWQTNSADYSASWARSAYRFAEGGFGAQQNNSSGGGEGGFGGGGAGAYGAGGGGGYSGGGCGDYQTVYTSGGGAGGSYIDAAGTSQTGQSGANAGHGQVVISLQ